MESNKSQQYSNTIYHDLSSNDTECAVLGCFLLDVKSLHENISEITETLFCDPKHKIIGNSLKEMALAGARIDLLTITQHLKKTKQLKSIGGATYISSLPNKVGSSANIGTWISILKEYEYKRYVLTVCGNAMQSISDISDAYETLLLLRKNIDDSEKILTSTFGKSREVTLDYIPNVQKDIVSLNGITILSEGNISCWIAAPGTGKSHLCEALVAACLNDDDTIDTLGLKAQLGNSKVLYVDTERDRDDCFMGMHRILRRISPNGKYTDFVSNHRFIDCDYLMFKEIPQTSHRRAELRKRLESKMYKLVVMDGITDLLNDVNSIEESTELINTLCAYASYYRIGIMVTIHNNFKNSKSGGESARGHTGGELMRKSQNYLLIKRSESDKSVRILTSKVGDNIKNRGGSDDIETAFIWDKGKEMFVSTDYVEPSKNSVILSIKQNCKKTFATKSRMLIEEFKNSYGYITKKSPRTVHRHLKEALAANIVVIDGAHIELVNENMF